MRRIDMPTLYDLCKQSLAATQRRTAIRVTNGVSEWWMGTPNNAYIRCQQMPDQVFLLSYLPPGKKAVTELWWVRHDRSGQVVDGAYRSAQILPPFETALAEAQPVPRVDSMYGLRDGSGQLYAIFQVMQEDEGSRPTVRYFLLPKRRTPSLYSRRGSERSLDLQRWWREVDVGRLSLLDHVIGRSRHPVRMGLNNQRKPQYILVEDPWTSVLSPAFYL